MNDRPRTLKWRLYGLIRPVVRPAMSRLRTYFTGRLHDDIEDLRREIRELRDLTDRQRIQGEISIDRQVGEVIAQALTTLTLDRERDPQPGPKP